VILDSKNAREVQIILGVDKRIADVTDSSLFLSQQELGHEMASMNKGQPEK
jgi:hypothetical protein